jgi:hypothetical protein
VFLRELISNASDALDRLRFESLTTNDLLEGDARFELRLEVDRAARTLTISDSGIGRDEVIVNIGAIAKSGTAEFQQLLNESVSSSTYSPAVKDARPARDRIVVPTRLRPATVNQVTSPALAACSKSLPTAAATAKSGSGVVVVDPRFTSSCLQR